MRANSSGQRLVPILATLGIAVTVGLATSAQDGNRPAPTKEEADVGRPGADKEHWAFRGRSRPQVPTVRGLARTRTPIDSFLLAKLEEKGLSFSPQADRITLLRRAYLDLWGLPPPPEAVDAFVADERPDAFERTLDMLLAS